MAAHLPVPLVEGAGSLVLTGVLATLWAWLVLSGASALVTVLATATALSLWLHVHEDRVWVGEDWIAASGLSPTFTIDLDAIATVDVPFSDLGPTELLIGHRRRGMIRLDLGRLGADPCVGAAVVRLLHRAAIRGATVSPDARQALDDLSRRVG